MTSRVGQWSTFAFAFVLATTASACARESVRGESSREAPTHAPSPEARAGSGGVVDSTAEVAARPDAAREALRFLSPPGDAELGAFLRTERLRAKGEGRLLVVYAGAPWCPPCRRFHAASHGGSLDASLGLVTLVELDADKDAERLAALGYVFKNIPYFAVPAENGKPTNRQLAVVDVTPGAQDRIVETLRRWTTARAGL
jgi:thiol-disulfide isomerase/thioredoxin